MPQTVLLLRLKTACTMLGACIIKTYQIMNIGMFYIHIESSSVKLIAFLKSVSIFHF